MNFPTVSGSNLLRQETRLPADLTADYNVILIAFQQWQQSVIDTWLPFVTELEQERADVRAYELPVIQRLNLLARTFINEGMRAGIPDRKARERTITLYLDKEAFRRALDMPDEQDIYALLLDRQGKVLWRTRGSFTLEKGQALKAAIAQRQNREPAPLPGSTVDEKVQQVAI